MLVLLALRIKGFCFTIQIQGTTGQVVFCFELFIKMVCTYVQRKQNTYLKEDLDAAVK